MEVEFICRFPKDITPEEQKDIDAQAKVLMHCDSDLTLAEARKKVTEDEPEQYSYGPWTIDMADIQHFNQVDKDHVRVITHNGMSIVFKIPYDQFKAIKIISTGKLVQSFLEFMSPMPPLKPKKTRGK